MRRIVYCEGGAVRGIAVPDPAITAFRGIPYAKPPVGDLRWRPPQPNDPWEGVLDAADFSYAAMQPQPGASNEFYDREWGFDPAMELREDCLTLNVWTPALRGSEDNAQCVKEGLPVMVWIHGGAYQCGNTAEKEFDGAHLASHGVVVVSMNYRLNVFGFLTHPLLEQEAQKLGGLYANYGLLDQLLALQWVHNNIEAFGGDPSRVTLFGQSAGAASVLAHICSPLSRGLFCRAIMQSGGGLGVFNKRWNTLEQAQEIGERFFALLGVNTLEEARALDSQTILRAAQQLPCACDPPCDWSMPCNWSPCIDGVFMPCSEAELLSIGEINDVEIIVGDATDEFLSHNDDGTVVQEGRDGNLQLLKLCHDAMSRSSYYYHFDPSIPGDNSGVFHSSDLWFTFGTLGTCWRPFSGEHYNIAMQMMQYWTNFAATGNPNGQGLVHWDPTTMPDFPALHIAEAITMETTHN